MESVILQKFQKEIIIALALILLGAGINMDSEYNPYESRVLEIDGMMQSLVENPSQDAADSVIDSLALQGDWAYRQTGEQKEVFEEYLEACKAVAVDVYYGMEADTSKMNEKKNELI